MLCAHTFPHILDSVIASAPPESLLALRATSRTLRDAADNRLFSHLEIVDRSTAHALVVAVRPKDTSLVFEWLRYMRTPTGEVTPHPEPRPKHGHRFKHIRRRSKCIVCKRKADAKARTTLRAYVHARVQHARVLDRRAIGESLNSWHGGTEEWIENKDEVLCCQVTEAVEAALGPKPPMRTLSDGSNYMADFAPMGDAIETRTPGRIAKAVRLEPNFLSTLAAMDVFGTDPDARLWTWTSGIAQSGGELVVHLLHREPGGSGSCARIGQRRYYPSMTTLVGGAAEICASLGMPSASIGELHAALDAGEQSGDPEPSWRTYLRLLTPEEYLAEVGAEQVALETKADPYSGPPAVYLK